MKKEDNKVEGILFSGEELFPINYHDSTYYHDIVAESDKKMNDFLNSVDPNFLESSGLLKKNGQEQNGMSE